jgi:hypothetical protein
VEYKAKRVLTTAQLAEVYETEVNNIHKNYSNNETRFIEGEHYYILKGDELQTFKRSLNDIPEPLKYAPSLFLWTEKGASRHCKILDTDMAWKRYDELEETYFRAKDMSDRIQQLPPELQMFKQIFDSQANIYLEQKRLETLALETKKDVADVREKFTAVKETFAEHMTNDWRKWVNTTFAKMNTKTGISYSELKTESYNLLSERTGVKLPTRVQHARDRLRDAGATKTAIEAYVTLSAIEDDKKLKVLYTSILKEMSIKYLI